MNIYNSGALTSSEDGQYRLLVDSITFRDYPTVQAMVLLLALTVLVANLLADLTYGVLDPRVSHSGRTGR